MIHWKSRFKTVVFLAVLVFSSTAYSVSGDSFTVEAENLPKLAFEALKTRYPDVSGRDVELTSQVYFNCNASPNIAGPSGIDHSTLNCMATVNFDVSASAIEYFYTDAKGHCRMLNPPETATVHMSPDGSSRVHFHPTNVQDGQYVECSDEVITRLASMDQKLPGKQAAFSVDAKKILELAYIAAVENHPEIPDEQLVYGDGPALSVACETGSRFGSSTPVDTVIDRCGARVRLANEAVKLEYRTVREGQCMIGKASDWVTVQIDELGMAQTRTSETRGQGRSRRVECNEAFYDSPLPLITGQN
ncbi:MAG TPA: hypothetical protein VJ984_04580 [Xanthomonadales bacterium]|nr:hypothetical protein [Xanthomonadales bacterium]